MVLMRHSRFMALTLSLLAGSGCGEVPNSVPVATSHNHDHDDHEHSPESLKDAITELTSLRNSIRDGFAKNDPDAAHDPLHEVGHVLEAVPELAKKEKASEENQVAIEAAVNTLMDAFGRVDKTLHGQEGSTYSEESATIDTALETLSQACGVISLKAETPAVNAAADETQDTPASVEETPVPAVDSGTSSDGKGE